MATPVIVLTDHLNGATGTLTIEEGHCCHFQCISASTLGGGEWVQAKVEWAINETSEPYNSGMRGFNFSHYCPTAGTYTVTCTVTNVNGETGVGQCVVTVAASTRTIFYVNEGEDLYTIWNANKGVDKEFVLTGNVTISNTITLDTNNVIRSSVRGTQRDLTLTVADKRFFTFGQKTNMTCVDMVLKSNVGGTIGHLFYTNGINANVIRCSNGRGLALAHCVNTESAPRGILVQDCDLVSTLSGYTVWLGPDEGTDIFSDRLLCVYGGDHIAEPTAIERVMRGHGRYIVIHNTLLQHEADQKEPLSAMEVDYLYCHKCDFYNVSTSGSGSVILVGHTSGTDSATNVVFDSCLMRYGNRSGGTIRIGPNNSAVGKVLFRNNIFVDVQIRVEKSEGAFFYHNTFINVLNSGINARSIRVYNTELVTLNKVAGNLMIWATPADYACSLSTITDTAFEVLDWSNNVSGSVSTGFDVSITDSVNGNKTENYATWNARSNASGNLRKTVTVDNNYRPSNTEDTDLLIIPDADMTIFADDYYGNQRVSATWLVGAVDRASASMYYTIRTSSGSLFLKTLGG